LINAINEVKCNVPVDPMSASASSPPNCPETIPLSGIPWSAEVEPKDVFHTFVPNVIHESEVKTVVPSGPIATAGSLLPLFSSNDVFENAIELVVTGFAALTLELSMQRETATTNNATKPNRIRRPPPGTRRREVAAKYLSRGGRVELRFALLEMRPAMRLES